MSETVTADLTDYGPQPRPTTPPADQVRDLSSLASMNTLGATGPVGGNAVQRHYSARRAAAVPKTTNGAANVIPFDFQNVPYTYRRVLCYRGGNY